MGRNNRSASVGIKVLGDLGEREAGCLTGPEPGTWSRSAAGQDRLCFMALLAFEEKQEKRCPTDRVKVRVTGHCSLNKKEKDRNDR